MDRTEYWLEVENRKTVFIQEIQGTVMENQGFKQDQQQKESNLQVLVVFSQCYVKI